MMNKNNDNKNNNSSNSLVFGLWPQTKMSLRTAVSRICEVAVGKKLKIGY